MKKVLISILAIFVLIAVPVSASDLLTGDPCGDNLTWSLNFRSGVLEICGTGNMYNYTPSSPAPWYEYSDVIEEVQVENGVTSIGQFAFYSFGPLESIIIPESVVEIRAYAFENCFELSQITIKNDTANIYPSAFDDTAYAQTESNYQDGGLYIGTHFIKATSFPEDFIVRDGTTAIAQKAFSHCTNELNSITLPASIKYIGNYAFESRYMYERLYINNLEAWCKIPFNSRNAPFSNFDEVFLDGEPMTDIVIPESISQINAFTFSDCYTLNSVTFHDNITYIGGYAFSCSNLEKISLPDKIININAYAFMDTAYYFDEANWSDDILYLGKHLLFASDEVDGHCTVKDGTLTIAEHAFKGNDIKCIVLPDSIKFIGASAFRSCNALTDIYYNSTADVWNKIEIGDNNDRLINAAIHFDYLNTQNPGFGLTMFSFVPKNVDPGSIIGVLVFKDGVSYTQTVTYNGTGAVTFNLATGFDKIKIFIWDSVKGMQPLSLPAFVQ